MLYNSLKFANFPQTYNTYGTTMLACEQQSDVLKIYLAIADGVVIK